MFRYIQWAWQEMLMGVIMTLFCCLDTKIKKIMKHESQLTIKGLYSSWGQTWVGQYKSSCGLTASKVNWHESEDLSIRWEYSKENYMVENMRALFILCSSLYHFICLNTFICGWRIWEDWFRGGKYLKRIFGQRISNSWASKLYCWC